MLATFIYFQKSLLLWLQTIFRCISISYSYNQNYEISWNLFTSGSYFSGKGPISYIHFPITISKHLFFFRSRFALVIWAIIAAILTFDNGPVFKVIYQHSQILRQLAVRFHSCDVNSELHKIHNGKSQVERQESEKEDKKAVELLLIFYVLLCEKSHINVVDWNPKASTNSPPTEPPKKFPKYQVADQLPVK